MELATLGWSAQWDAFLQAYPAEKIGRIIRVERGQLWLQTPTALIPCILSGKFYHLAAGSSELPNIGDWCAISDPFVNQSNQNSALIEELFPRQSWISRVASGSESKPQIIAANVDYAFIVTSSNSDFSINRIKRYVLLAQAGQVTPIVILSKIDLDPDHAQKMDELNQHFPDLATFATSTDDPNSLQPLQSMLTTGKTAVLLGSSGVGKSSMTNLLLQEQAQDTQQVRQTDDKGKHTTTNRQLFFIPDQGMIIDSPGLREVQINVQQKDLDDLFYDITELSSQCKFSDCSHEREPSCQIIEALANNTLDQSNWNQYLKLQKEIEFLARKTDTHKAVQNKKKWKKIQSDYQQQKKLKKKNS